MHQQSDFYGQTYLWPTPNDGPREIGVTHGLGGLWIVGWKTDTSTRRINTALLPPGPDPLMLQAMFDAWAGERRLKMVPLPGAPGFVIRRDVGNLPPRYLTRGGGWTNNKLNARQLPSFEAAQAEIGSRQALAGSVIERVEG